MDITILAVSKRLNGVCIAGVDKRNKWIRPVKKEELMLPDIKLEKGYIEALNTYELHFSSPCPVQCQTENFLIDTNWPIFPKGEIQDRLKFFIPLCENSIVVHDRNIADVLKSKNRSLVMLGPVRLMSAYFHKENGEMKAPEITFSVNNIQVKGVRDSLLCTDLKFYSFARNLLKDKDELTLNETELKSLLGYFRVYVVIGLTKLHKGVNWPMVIGLHTVPGYGMKIDYDELLSKD
jgi:hypothetical protein